MFSFINRTVFDIPLTWDRTYFQATRSKYRQARKLIENSINVQFQKELKNLHLQNENIERNITETNEYLSKHNEKVSIFNQLTNIASDSLSIHLNKRMENTRTMIEEHCHAIQTILQDENQYWERIHLAMDQNLITSKDIYPCVPNTSKVFDDDPLISVELDLSSLQEMPISIKEEHVNVVLPSINKTYAIKLEETMDRLSSIETSPLYSQPNPPGQLYFSPTILQDEQSEPIRNILSSLDQNQTTLIQPKVLIHRVSQAFVLDYFKTKGNNPQNCFSTATKTEPESLPTRKTRKRKQSVSEDNERTFNTIALRQRRSVSYMEIEEKKPRKRRKQKMNKKQKIPIRESSPLPRVDRSKHYNTGFSTHSRRFNEKTLSTMNTEHDDGTNQSKSHSRHSRKKH